MDKRQLVPLIKAWHKARLNSDISDEDAQEIANGTGAQLSHIDKILRPNDYIGPCLLLTPMQSHASAENAMDQQSKVASQVAPLLPSDPLIDCTSTEMRRQACSDAIHM